MSYIDCDNKECDCDCNPYGDNCQCHCDEEVYKILGRFYVNLIK